MKKVQVFHSRGETTITAPEGKEMVFDPQAMQHNVLAIGEFGPSGVKVAAFNQWDYALFMENGENGYSIIEPTF